MKEDSNKLKKNTSLVAHGINVAAFFFFLLLGGVLSVILPKENISEVEQRALTPFPTYSFYALMEEKYTDSLDLFYADNFPLREKWVVLTSAVKNEFGFRQDDLMIYNTQVDEIKTADSVERDSLLSKQKLLLSDTLPPLPEKPGGIMIYNGRAFQRFQGSEPTGLAYAGLINAYRDSLPDSIAIYSLIIPGPNDFYLPQKLTSSYFSIEKNSIDFIYEHQDSLVTNVDAYKEIEAHIDEYLYFHTDHHWTARGAYYAYRAFCKSAGITPLDLNNYERKVRKKYLGSLYNQTLDTKLKANPDSLEYFRIPTETKAFRYVNAALDTVAKTQMLLERIKGPSYLIFLGGDHPLIHIQTEQTNRRRIFIFKDSFGNAFVPYLAMHYQDIFIADYRYFNKNVLDFIKRNKITDLLFIHNTFVVNSKFVVTREGYLLRSKIRAPLLITPDSLEVQSIPDKED